MGNRFNIVDAHGAEFRVGLIPGTECKSGVINGAGRQGHRRSFDSSNHFRMAFAAGAIDRGEIAGIGYETLVRRVLVGLGRISRVTVRAGKRM